jgi:hypothetical protein
MQRDIEKAFRRVGLEPKNINGKPAVILGDFTITFYNYYFIVDGKVPLAVAEELYNEGIVGREDIRSGGDCGCRPPKTWVTRITPSGKIAIKKSESDKIRDAIASEENSLYKDAMATGKYELTDSENQYDSYPGYIDCYHIDSELGLYIFVQKLKQHQLIPT